MERILPFSSRPFISLSQSRLELLQCGPEAILVCFLISHNETYIIYSIRTSMVNFNCCMGKWYRSTHQTYQVCYCEFFGNFKYKSTIFSSFFPDVMPGLRFPVGITGQAIAALAYPFIMFLPTKVTYLK